MVNCNHFLFFQIYALVFESWLWKSIWFLGILIWPVQRSIVFFAHIQDFCHEMCMYLQMKLNVRELSYSQTLTHFHTVSWVVHLSQVVSSKWKNQSFNAITYTEWPVRIRRCHKNEHSITLCSPLPNIELT